MKLAVAAAFLLVSQAWAQQPPDLEILATDLGSGSFTGQVAVDDGRILATYFDGASHAYVLEPSGQGWSVAAELVPNTPSWTTDPITCIALSGDHALVGYGRSRRAAFFERGAAGWSESLVIVAPSGSFTSSFATAAAIEGDLAILGVSSNIHHRNLVFRYQVGSWTQTQTLGVGRATDIEIANGLVVIGNGYRNGAIQGHSSAISGQVSVAPVLPSGDVGALSVLPGPLGWDLVEGRLGMSVATDGSFVSATWSGHPEAWFEFEMSDSHIVTWTRDSGGTWALASTYSYPGNVNNTDRVGHGLAWDGEQLVTGLGGFGIWLALRQGSSGPWEQGDFLLNSAPLTIDHRTLDARPGLIAAVAGGVPIDLYQMTGAYERLLLWSSPVGERLCTSQPNSTTRAARVYAAGSASIARDRLTIGTAGLPPGALTILLVGGHLGFTPNPGGSQGDLCLGTPLGRFTSMAAAATTAGRYSITLPLTQPLPGMTNGVQPGEIWFFQAWYRDSNPAPTSNFSDAVGVTFD